MKKYYLVVATTNEAQNGFSVIEATSENVYTPEELEDTFLSKFNNYVVPDSGVGEVPAEYNFLPRQKSLQL